MVTFFSHSLLGSSQISFGPGIWMLHNVISDLSGQPLNFRTKTNFTHWHSTLTAVLGALNIIKLWPTSTPHVFLAHTQLGNRHSLLPAYLDVEGFNLKPSTKFEYLLHPHGCEGLGQLAPCLSPDFACGAWDETSVVPPQAHVGHVTRRIPTRRGPRRDNRWEKEEDGLGTTLPWLTVLAHLKLAFSPHPRRTLPALRTRCSREHRTQTAPIAVHTTRTNTTGVEPALRALAPSTLHILRRNRRHVPLLAAGLRPVGSCKPSPSVCVLQFEFPPEVLFRHTTRSTHEVGRSSCR
ncbi:hypothetical protein B0H19DRAFT_1078179 [Mycena capillaripes]|nr:hypothetical protein B0H19DRAFT_1078179 [Mycena capillaripes]